MSEPRELPEFTRAQRGKRYALVHPDFVPAVAEALIDGKDVTPANVAGRGELLRVATSNGNVLIRKYRRGGFIGKFVRDKYLLENRPHRELNVHQYAWKVGVPTVLPVGAMWVRSGPFFSGAFATLEANAVDLLAYLQSDFEPDPLVLEICGHAIRAMYEAKIDHADLQVKNILISDGKALIIDFDNARIWPTPSIANTTQNIGRLRRSFAKHSLSMEAFETISRAALTPKG